VDGEWRDWDIDHVEFDGVISKGEFWKIMRRVEK